MQCSSVTMGRDSVEMENRQDDQVSASIMLEEKLANLSSLVAEIIRSQCLDFLFCQPENYESGATATWHDDDCFVICTSN